MNGKGLGNWIRRHLCISAFVSGVAASVLSLAAEFSFYALGRVMDGMAAMEKSVALDKPSLRSAELFFSEGAVGLTIMLAVLVTLALFPALWGWWAARVEGMQLPRRKGACILLLVLALPPILTATLLCLVFVRTLWAQKICAMLSTKDGGLIWINYFILLPISRSLWKRAMVQRRGKVEPGASLKAD